MAAVILGSISLVLLLICLALILLRRHLQGARCHSLVRLEDKVAVVTGANTGIGFETALDLSSRGAKVILLCRSLERGEAAATTIKAATGGEVEVEKLDLASLASVRECAAKLVLTLEKIHILVNNAGVMACPLTRTEDGFEMQIGTNHFGHFYLTNLLLPLIKKVGQCFIALLHPLLCMPHTPGYSWGQDSHGQFSGSQKWQNSVGRHQLGED